MDVTPQVDHLAGATFFLLSDAQLTWGVDEPRELERLRELTWQKLGPVSVLMNNAGTGLGGGRDGIRYRRGPNIVEAVHATSARSCEAGRAASDSAIRRCASRIAAVMPA